MMRVGIDVGGTHISAALVAGSTLLAETYRRVAVDPGADAMTLLEVFGGLLDEVVGLAADAGGKGGGGAASPVEGIGVAMPGPFNYSTGLSLIKGLNKYESFYGLNVKEALRYGGHEVPICFGNDAACFGLGEARSGQATAHRKIIAITLGTGLGACFIDGQNVVTTGAGVPPNGYLYCIPFGTGIAEDHLSARWLLAACPAADVKAIADKALIDKDRGAMAAFEQFGANLGRFLAPWLQGFGADALVIGGSISQSFGLFGGAMQTAFTQHGVAVDVIVSLNPELMAIAGAASLVQPEVTAPPKRKSLQGMLPKGVGREEQMDRHEQIGREEQIRRDEKVGRDDRMGRGEGMGRDEPGGYDMYPFEPLGDGHIFSGYGSLARWIISQGGARLDGYAGIDWGLVRTGLCAALRGEGVRVLWYEAAAWQKPEAGIDALVGPFLGEVGSVWGTKTTLPLADFFTGELGDWEPEVGGGTIVVLAGAGSGLSPWNAPVVYFDLPKNELQYRMRASSATNLGSTVIGPFAEMYKRSYFVDWVVLNQHRRDISGQIAVVVDGQHEEAPNWCLLASLRQGATAIAHNLIRARPWFEPGVWGGQWLKQHIPTLAPDEINYAWSFELIAPENGIVFESDGLLLEIAFDWLMEWESADILGVDADRFGEEFPIRFDFLDTFDGGNLSIQCHPSLPYIQQHFGESITQDETYYILDCTPDAGVYLGFTEDIDAAGFREALENSQDREEAMDIKQYVQLLPAHKHDLFLIPNRTIHGAGVNNLVLEISATPYIFTFKMYDWMRLDLDGRPRPINIEHAFRNLDFNRKGARVGEELVSKPRTLKKGLELLPTHPDHFYSIHRITLSRSTRINTGGRCHLLMLVEGDQVTVTTRQGRTYHLHYAETFIIPAAAEEYQLHNPGDTPIKIIKAFVK